MSQGKKIATRESYGRTLAELGKEHEDFLVLDADLAGSTKTAVFRKAFPERHINCGIAEQNMVGVAAGIAATGWRLQVRLRCLRPAEPMSRFETPSATRSSM